MNERQLRHWIEDVREGRLPRRTFLQRMAAVGLSAPLGAQLLMHAGIAQAQTASTYKPTKRGGGGALRLLWWQGPTLLNPHFASGTKDQEGSRIFYESLAIWDNDANLVPILAAEIPTRANGGLSADGRSVTWKLKRGVNWHDGQPFTADDCVFNWEFARDPATAAVTSGFYKDVKVEKIDSHTVRVVFQQPTPFWATTFVGNTLIPKHLFAAYSGAKSRDAPANLKPVGTGPYRFVEFKPGDMVRGELNPNYHLPNRPYFDTIEMKGGGDAASAARAVIQTGEYDYAWNLLVEDEILKRMEDGGKGRAHMAASGNIEFILLNATDPWTEVEGERAHISTRHFAFSEAPVRKAMALLVDRKAIQEFIFGRAAVGTANYINNPPRFRSPNTRMDFSVEKANELLDGAGWKRGADGIREKGGRKLKFVFQTSVNGLRQKVQAVVKQACQKAGIDVELKSVTAGVFFSSDYANPDTNSKFWCDMEMYQLQMGPPDPETLMKQFLTTEVATKANKWQGRNISRWRSEEYDKLYDAAEGELDPLKRAALFIRMNDLAVNTGHVIPLMNRMRVQAVRTKLAPTLTSWDLDLAFLHDWYREA
ncbi:MAG: peptide ABC transporter substrate-binding protein [Ramlibacter sp.]|nr:peptide ABC transporter substrate-binding protein [Ramlibacter sp.]